MTNLEKLQQQLLTDIAKRGLKAWRINVGLEKNPYPIGKRGVYLFATQGKATDSQKWKMMEFFGGIIKLNEKYTKRYNPDEY
jgi:hypothetical protein